MNPKKEKWTHIAQEYVVSLFPNIGIVSAFTGSIKKSAGENLKFFAQKYENNSCQYLVKSSDYKKVSGRFAKKIIADPNKLSFVIKNIKKLAVELIAAAQKISRADFRKKSNKEFYQYFSEFYAKNFNVYTWGLSLVLLDFQDTTYVSDALAKNLKGKVSGKEFSDYFTTLSSPTERTIAREEEINLLKIIIKICKKSEVKNLFLKNINEILPALKKHSAIYKLISEHSKKFCWITYVYEGPAMELNDFVLVIKEFVERNNKADIKLKNILKSEKELKVKQVRYLKNLKADEYFKKIIKLSQDVTFVKPWRREQQSHAYFLIEGVLKEMARRLGISVKQLRFLTPGELKECLVDKRETPVEKINRRMKLCILAVENGRKLKIVEGRDALKFVKNIKEEKIDFNKKEFSGQIAQTGKVKGKVKIINTPDDMNKMGEGDILVSFATNPNLMPVIRRASAIVTDEGGLTCHASIVSRELGIPCIVGTKIATKVLRDGDLVEVDANKGVVNILK